MIRDSSAFGLATGVYILIVAFFLVVVFAAGGALQLWALPWVTNQQTTINRASIGYVETKSNLLLKLQQDYADPKATDEQKAAIVRRMKAERALLQPDQVPPSVDQFLRGK